MDIFPRITIITPSLNQGRFIESTIQSVLEQKYPDLEYIVVDGGSTDNTLDILQRYSGRLRWISEKDAGQSDAINKGLHMATGDIIAFLNSDDLYLPNTLISVGRFFAGHPQAAWLSGRCINIDEHGHEIRRPITWYKNFWLLWGSYNILLVLDYISQPATFWRRRVFEKVGEFDTNEHYAFDYDFSLRTGQYFELWRSNRRLAAFRIHTTSKGSTAASTQFASALAIAKRYTGSAFLITLHRWHDDLTLVIYGLLSKKTSRGK